MSHPPTFRLDQPSGAADGSEDNELGKVGIVCGEIATHHGIIGRIPQVGDGLGDVVCCGSRLGQEGGDVLHHAFGLPDDIALIQDSALVIDAGCARDQYVREFDISTSLLNMSMSQPEHVLQHKKARKYR